MLHVGFYPANLDHDCSGRLNRNVEESLQKKRFACGINKEEEWTHQKQWFPSNFPLVGAQPFSWYNSLET
jgi:hypothetical protein